jgi:hypothetical protein
MKSEKFAESTSISERPKTATNKMTFREFMQQQLIKAPTPPTCPVEKSKAV